MRGTADMKRFDGFVPAFRWCRTVHTFRECVDKHGFQNQARRLVLPHRGAPRPLCGNRGHVDTGRTVFGHRRSVFAAGAFDPFGDPRPLPYPHRLVDQSVVVVIVQLCQTFPVSFQRHSKADPRRQINSGCRPFCGAERDLLERRSGEVQLSRGGLRRG